MNAATKAAKFLIPQPNEGEVYVGSIINPDGTGHHVFLLAGDNDDADWQTQMDWAKSIGGDLPDRIEQAMLYKHFPQQFQPDWYWSNTQRASGSAWFQYFDYGHQCWGGTSLRCRARAVRRIAI